MHLKDWVWNNKSENMNQFVKTLGLMWNPATDMMRSNFKGFNLSKRKKAEMDQILLSDHQRIKE